MFAGVDKSLTHSVFVGVPPAVAIRFQGKLFLQIFGNLFLGRCHDVSSVE